MTLQEIADYAMDYLDGKGIAADYEITSTDVKIYADCWMCWLHESITKESIVEAWLDAFI